VEFVLRFRAAEFAVWKQAFNEQRALRVKHGAIGHQVSQLVGDPQDFQVVIQFTSPGGAKGYAEEATRYELQRIAMIEGGIHERWYWDESIRETIDAETYGYTPYD
jgi:hypothetical protein